MAEGWFVVTDLPYELAADVAAVVATHSGPAGRTFVLHAPDLDSAVVVLRVAGLMERRAALFAVGRQPAEAFAHGVSDGAIAWGPGRAG